MVKNCLCKSVRAPLILCKLFGLCPLSWKHVNGHCFFSYSKCWIIYSITLASFIIYMLSQTLVTQFEYTADSEAIVEYVTKVNHNIWSTFIITMIILNIIRVKKIAQVFNKCVELTKYDLLCSSNLKVLKIEFYGGLLLFSIFYIAQYAAIVTLNIMSKYDTDWTPKRMSLPFLQNTPMLLSVFVGIICIIISTLLTCFEKIMMINLDFVPFHPMPNFDETHENRKMLIFYKYQRCKDCHEKKIVLNNPLQKVEMLKQLYKKIRDCVSATNEAFNPQLVAYMAFEILALVLQWFLVIMYFTIDEPSPRQCTINVFNWIFVTMHTLNIYMFLLRADQVEQYVSTSILQTVHKFKVRLDGRFRFSYCVTGTGK